MSWHSAVSTNRCVKAQRRQRPKVQRLLVRPMCWHTLTHMVPWQNHQAENVSNALVPMRGLGPLACAVTAHVLAPPCSIGWASLSIITNTVPLLTQQAGRVFLQKSSIRPENVPTGRSV